MTSIDLESVPPFPIYTLQLDEDVQRLELDGMPLEPSYGQDPHEVGIEAVARKAQSQGLEAVRVRIHSTNGDLWDMIVTADGDAVDTTQPADGEEANTPRSRRKLLMPVILAVAVLGIAGGIAAAFLVVGGEEPEIWTVPGTDAQIPIALPHEFSSQAAWSIPVHQDADVTALESGHILATGTNANLIARDPETAQPVWKTQNAPSDLTSLVQTQWQAKDVLAAYAGRTLYVWNIQLPEGQDRAQAHTINIEHQWRIDLNGQAPMVDMGDWIVGVPGQNYGLDQLVIPAGTRPLTATRDGGVIAASQDQFFTIDSTGETTNTIGYTTADDVETVPDQLWMLDDDHVLLGWDTEEPTLSMYRLSDGEQVATSSVQRLPRQDVLPVIDTASHSAALDDIALSWGPDDAAIHSIEGLEISAVHDNTAYGVHRESGPVSLDLTDAEADPEPWESYNPDDPAPDLVTDDAAYVIAPQLDRTILYQAPVTTRSEDSQ